MIEYLEKVPEEHLDDPHGFKIPPLDGAGLRDQLVCEYGWAIPSEEAIATLVAVSPLVEIGAGGGYWSYLLREQGADVIAYEPYIGKPYGRGFRHATTCRVWTDLVEGDHTAAARHPDRTLLMIWPAMDGWAGEALKLYAEAGGRRVAYVGEGMGGCTADDDFHNGLAEFGFDGVRTVDIPQWWGIHDYLWIGER